MNADIRINFNGFTCWYSDLQRYLDSISWHWINEGDILPFTENCNYADYNFRVFKIIYAGETYIVELIAEKA
jgi:hypothetical protein